MLHLKDIKDWRDAIGQVVCADCLDLIKIMPDKSIDLTVTSPPYDNLRDYHGYNFDFENIAEELYRIIKEGGVVVWIVGDATIDGSETGTSFRQALYFKEIGFNLHDTMIWRKDTFTAVGALVNKYAPVFEFMFIFSKDIPKTFNPIKDRKNITVGQKQHGTIRQPSGDTVKMSTIGNIVKKFGQRYNVWDISAAKSNKNRLHPAVFPECLAKDHITSWSNPDDLVLDPMAGSFTTAKCAEQLGRKWLACDISEKYCEIGEKRIAAERAQGKLFR